MAMTRLFDPRQLAGIVACIGLLAGCSSSNDSNGGTVSIALMDRPVDGIAELWVTISEVWLKPAGTGPAEMLPMTTTPMTVNLLALGADTASVLVDDATVAPGDYNWIELKIEDADITQSYAINDVGGTEPVDVDVPSGKIRLVSGFTVGDAQAVRLLFDWDVRKGLTNPVGRPGYLLRPAFRILNVDEYGSVSGTITTATLAAETTCAMPDDTDVVVYVYEGSVTPDEIGGSPEPLTTVNAWPSTSVSGEYEYRTVLMPGEYTLALTCEGSLDTDADGDGITLIAPAAGNPIMVTTAALTGIDF
jgi:hypothetical protein